MSDDNLSLRDLFVNVGESGNVRLPSDRLVPELKRAVQNQSKAIKWDALQDVIGDKVMELLDVPVLGILLSAWEKSREVNELAESEVDPKKVALVQHTLKSEHHPHLEVRLKGVLVATLNFTIVVELVLDGFILTIQDRKITAVETGRMKGQGSLALESTVVLEKDFGDIQLPGIMTLGDGIPLQ